jgi:hypothetical protein
MEVGDRVILTIEGARAHRAYLMAHNAIAFGPFLGAFTAMGMRPPEAGMRGEIVDKKPRAFGQRGYDYEVEWAENAKSRTDWHLRSHLQRDPSDEPLPWDRSPEELEYDLLATEDDL